MVNGVPTQKAVPTKQYDKPIGPQVPTPNMSVPGGSAYGEGSKSYPTPPKYVPPFARGGSGGGGGNPNNNNDNPTPLNPTPTNPTQIPQAPRQQTTQELLNQNLQQRYAVYYPGTKTTQAGFYTSDNKFYPYLNRGGKTNSWSPTGYNVVPGTSSGGGISVPTPTTSNTIAPSRLPAVTQQQVVVQQQPNRFVAAMDSLFGRGGSLNVVEILPAGVQKGLDVVGVGKVKVTTPDQYAQRGTVTTNVVGDTSKVKLPGYTTTVGSVASAGTKTALVGGAYVTPVVGETLMAIGAYQGIKTATNPTLSTPQRVLGGVEAGASLFFLKGSALKTISSIEKPVYSTRFLTEQATTEAGKTTATTVGITTRKGLLSDRQFLFATKSQSATTQVGEADRFVQGTVGVQREIAMGFRGNMVAVSKPQTFGEVSLGLVTKEPIKVPIQKGLNVQIEEGFGYRAASKTINAGSKAESSVSAGVGGKVPGSSDFFLLSKSNKNSNALGIVRQAPQEVSNAGGSQIFKTTTQSKAVQKSLTTSTVEKAIEQNIKASRNTFGSRPITGLSKGIVTAKTLPNVIPSVTKPLNIKFSMTGSAIQEQQPQTSAYAGTGQYERTTDTVSPIFKVNQAQPSVISVKQPEVLKIAQPTVERTRTRQGTGEIFKQPQREKIIELPKEATQQRTNQRVSSAFKTPTATRLEEGSSSISIPRVYNPSMSKYKPSALSSPSRKAYDVLVRRFGKDITIAKSLPKGLALREGVGNISKTLGRSFKLKESGTTTREDISFTPSAQIFRPGKRDASRIVQRAKFSLSSGTERSEIKSARRRKTSKKFKLL